MIYKHLLTFRMVDFNGNVAYDTAEVISNSAHLISDRAFKKAQSAVIDKNHTELAGIVVVNSLVTEVEQ